MAKRKQKEQDFDLHILATPEDENMVALYTVSIGRRAVCVDMPLDEAVDHIREVLLECFDV